MNTPPESAELPQGAFVVSTEAIGLLNSVQQWKTPDGVEIVAACDRGTDIREDNQDRVGIHLHHNFAAAVDGMGGHSGGAEAAQLLTEELIGDPTQTEEAASRAHERILVGGACFAAAKLSREEGQWILRSFHAGDCRCYAIDKDGNLLPDTVTSDESFGHIVINSIGGNGPGLTNCNGPFVLPGGSLVVLHSDGLPMKPEDFVRTTWAASGGDLRKAVELLETLQTDDNRSVVLMQLPEKPVDEAITEEARAEAELVLS